jgi:peptidoglycan-associated lipoprotein
MRKAALIAAATVLLLLSASCPKAVSPARVPPPPAPLASSKPSIAIFSVEPTTISEGQTASLRWSVKDASSIRIDNSIGPVGPEDHVDIHPSGTTTYTIEAANGSDSANATVTVIVTRPLSTGSGSDRAHSAQSTAKFLASQLQDIHFDYGKNDVPDEDKSLLDNDATVLKNIFQNDPELLVTIEGHCDERGSAEYNMALGDRRANFIKDYLVGLGVPEGKLGTLSYGKERPVCVDATEHCFAQNRRAHFSLLP